jgi:hypothetical protein
MAMFEALPHQVRVQQIQERSEVTRYRRVIRLLDHTTPDRAHATIVCAT